MIGRRPPRPNLPLAYVLLLAATVAFVVVGHVHLPASSGVLVGLPLPVVVNIVLFTVTLASLFGTYAYAIYSLRSVKGGWGVWTMLVLTALLTVPAAASPDLLSNDVYGYAFYGRMVWLHHLNPYVVRPAAVRNDPYLTYVDWRDIVTPYGPIWTSWSALLGKLVPGGIQAQIVAFKLTAGLTHLLNTLLVGAIARKVSPRHTGLAMGIYGWNPLAIFEFAGNAHNESLMVFWVLLALLAFVRQRALLSVALLALAVATKFSAMLFAPFLVIAILRGARDRRELARQAVGIGAVGATVWVASWLPYLSHGGWHSMVSLPEPSKWYMNSLPTTAYTFVRDAITLLWGMPPIHAGDIADLLVSVASTLGILLLGVRLGLRMRRQGNLVEMWFWFGFAYLVIAASYFQPWYVTALIPLAALARRWYIWALTTALSLSAMMMYSCDKCQTYLVNNTDSPFIGLVVFLLPLTVLAAMAWRDYARRSVERTVRRPVVERTP